MVTQRIETDTLNSNESQALWWKTILSRDIPKKSKYF